MDSAYIVSYRNYLENVKVDRFETRSEAEAVMKIPGQDGARGAFMVQDDGDLRGVSTQTLLGLYNMWRGDDDREVVKFESRSVAHSRFLIRLEMRFKHLPASRAPAEDKRPEAEAPAAGAQTAQEEGEDMATKSKKAKAKKERVTNGAGSGSRVVGKPAGLVGAFRQVRPGTARQKILKLMASGSKTVKQIADAVELDEKTVLVHANTMHRDCGIGYKVDEGKLVALFPGSKTYDDAVKADAPSAK